MSNVYPSPHPLVAHKLTKLRDANTEPKKFRELVRELAGLLCYEATADLEIAPRSVQTPLMIAPGANPACRIGDGRRDLGINAFGGGVAHRYIS